MKTKTNKALKDCATNVKDAVKEDSQMQVERARRVVGQKLQKTRQQMNKVGKNMETYVKQNPAKSVYIAAGVGAAIGAVATASILKSE